jgi:hypothetical protein
MVNGTNDGPSSTCSHCNHSTNILQSVYSAIYTSRGNLYYEKGCPADIGATRRIEQEASSSVLCSKRLSIASSLDRGTRAYTHSACHCTQYKAVGESYPSKGSALFVLVLILIDYSIHLVEIGSQSVKKILSKCSLLRG